jgi:exosortase
MNSVWKSDRFWQVWGIPLLVSIGIMTGLYGFFPYAVGYGDKPASVFDQLSSFWRMMDEWDHGMLVPLISAGLIYWKWEDISKVPIEGHPVGLAVMAVALLVYWVGYMIDITFVGFASAQLMVGGLILWFLGWKFFLAILFPYCFLAFTWPYYFAESAISLPLRHLMSTTAYHLLNLLGISTLKVGTALISAPDTLGNLQAGDRFRLDVADPCSGIRSLFALVMLSSLYGYVAVEKGWIRLAAFLAAFPLAVLGNLARVLMLTFGTLLLGTEVAIGTDADPSFFHNLSGYLVFLVAFTGLALWVWLLDGGARIVIHRIRGTWDRLSQPPPAVPRTHTRSHQDPY